MRRSALPLSIAIAALSVCIFLAAAPRGFSYEYYSSYGNKTLEGEVAGVSVNPAKPFVLEDAVVTVAVRNLQNHNNEYVLRTFVSKDGQVIEEKEFAFNLNANKEMSMTFAFSTTKVGKHSVVAKLYDSYKAVLYSEKILEVEVFSEIGPFDVQLDALSHTIRPGYEIPLLLTMKNMGLSGTDVQVEISMECTAQGRIHKDLSLFLEGLGRLDKSLSISACSEEGYHEIAAKIVMFDGVLAQSSTTVFINNTEYPMYVRAPKIIEARMGFPKVFDIYVRNDGEDDMNNMRALLNGLPAEWLSIMPKYVTTIAPAGSAIFIVNVSVPADADAGDYPFMISLGGDETLAQREAVLEVIEAGAPEARPAWEALPYDAGLALQAAAALALAGVIAFAVWRFSKMRPYGSRRAALEKIKDMIRANE